MRGLRLRQGQVNYKAGPLALGAGYVYFTVMPVDDLLNDGQPQTGTGLPGGEEWRENVFHGLLVHPAAAVFNLQADGGLLFLTGQVPGPD